MVSVFKEGKPIKSTLQIFAMVFLEEKWTPQASEWQKEMTLGISLLGTHLLIIWSGQYLNKYGSS